MEMAFEIMLFWFLSLLMIILLSWSNSLFWSCLMLVSSALMVGFNLLQMNFNWLMYTLILLYVGGMMVLFIYMCSLSSFSKIEVSGLKGVCLMLIVFYLSSLFHGIASFSEFNTTSSELFTLFSTNSESVLLFLSVYLILGLMISVFMMEKFQGPLKSSSNE